MSKTIIIDDREYSIADLPDEVRAILGLMQENQVKMNRATVDLQLANAANARLQTDLGELMKDVDPIPPAKVGTAPAKRQRKVVERKK